MGAERWVGAALVVAALGAVASGASADAAFPGRNGLIVFSSDRAENRATQLYAVPAGGGRARNLTQTPSASHSHPTPSPDGTRLAFIVLDRGYALWTMRRDGSERRRLATASDSPPAWSPDGRWIVYRAADGSLAAAKATGDQIVLIAAGGELPSWSPDGRRIAFVRGDSYFVVTDGVERQVATGLTVVRDVVKSAPSWAPDSSRFVVSAGRPEPSWWPTGPSDLYVVDARTGAATRLTSTQDSEGSPRWSPDGSRIVLARRTFEPVAFDVAVVPANGGEVRSVVRDAYSPTWAPDGRRILFTRARHLHVVDVTTGASRQVTRHSAREAVESGAWAPDGRTVYVAKRASNVLDLFTVDPRGGAVRRLTTSLWDFEPRWSPDGRRVAFARGNPLSAIYVIGANGRGLIRLGCPPRSECRSPTWSADGRRIAFGAIGDGVVAIAVVNADGRGRRMIAEGLDPAWSPDGRRIAFRDDEGNIVSVRPDGRGESVLVRADPEWFVNHSPSWSPDGRRLAFLRTRYDCAGCENLVRSRTIVVARVDGTGERDLGITSSPGVGWSPDGRQLVFEQHGDIAVVNADGTGFRRVTSGGAVDLYPDWQPLRRRR